MTLAAGATLALAALAAAATAPVRELAWDDLLPPATAAAEGQVDAINRELGEQPAALQSELRRLMYDLMGRRDADQGAAVTDEEYARIEADIEPQHQAAAIGFWQRVKHAMHALRQLETAVAPALDGQAVRMPGYLLPLEFEGRAVREFLLVPYVGACIHVPPPPPNQMVYVTAREAVSADGLYAPVWVEGTLRTSAGTYDLQLVDGNSPVEAGYVMEAISVRPYEAAR